MDKTGYIEIHISGKNGNLEIKPDNYDIRELIPVLENAEKLLNPDNKRNRPHISYEIHDGSVKHRFITSMQQILAVNAIMASVAQYGSVDFLEHNTALAFENLQKLALEKNYTLDVYTSLKNSNKLEFTPKTKYFRKNNTWINAEFYFYGKITSAGGKDKANIHLNISDRILLIQTPVDILEHYQENILYKTMGLYVTGKQDSETGEIDFSSFEFKDFVDYQPKYDEKYLNELREKAEQNWLAEINSEDWINEIRGR